MADGEYTLELDFMQTVIEKVATLTAGDNATFDKDELNEQFTYTGQVKDGEGQTVSFEIEGQTYDCIEFTTKKKVDEEPIAGQPPPDHSPPDEPPTPVYIPPPIGPPGPQGEPGLQGETGPAGPPGSEEGSLNFLIDGGTQVITTGLKSFVEWGFNATVTGWTLLADVTGSIVIDVWKDTYGNFQPTIADTITGTEKPTLVSAQKNQDLSLTSFFTTVTTGDIWAFNVDSVTDIKKITLAFRFNKI